jgi:hypothetical protein
VPRVIDFGIAKAEGRLHTTEVGVRKGKFAYMAPEQVRGKEVDRRTDVYAAGLVLWEMLTGRRLHHGSSDLALMGKRAASQAPAPPPSSLRGLPREVDAVVLCALEEEPDARFATARDMAGAVRHALGVASNEEVAAWVDSLAHERIAAIDAKVREVTDAFASGDLDELTTISAEIEEDERTAISSLVFDVPDLDLPPATPGSVPVPAPSSRSMAGMRGTPSPRQWRPLPPDRSSEYVVGETLVSAGAVPPTPPDGSVRGAPSSARPVESPARAPGSSTKTAKTALFAGFAIVTLAVLFRLSWPVVLQAMATHAAAKRGVMLSFDGISTEGATLVLTGAAFVVGGEADASLRVPEARVAVDWLGNIQHVDVSGFSFTARGNAVDVAGRLSDWASGTAGGGRPFPLPIAGTGGHVAWSDAVAPGVGLEANDVAVHGTLGDGGSVHLQSPSLTMTVRGTPLGPWPMDLSSSGDESKLVIALDPSKPPPGPTFSLVRSVTLGKSFALTIPREKVSQLGVPPTLLGIGADPEVEVSLEGELFPRGDNLTAHARASLFGATIPVLDGATDVTIDGSVNGPHGKPLRITKGSLKMRGVTTPFVGVLSTDRGAIVAELTLPGRKQPIAFDTRTFTQPRPH